MSFPLAVAVCAAGTLAAGAAHQAHATIQTRRKHHGWTAATIDCETTNRVVAYRRERGPDAPEIFFEAGLMNTSTSWLLLADALRTCTVTIYDRAGYRASHRRQREPYSLSESVSDFIDVVTSQRRAGAPAWLIGHSLGGYMVHRAASAIDDVAGLVLLDPMHPQELVTSEQQRTGARTTDLSMRTGPPAIALGGGLLLDKPGLLQAAHANPYRDKLSHELSAVSTWSSAAREWRYAYTFMLDGGAPLVPLAAPVHVMAASQTVAQSPEQRDLYADYVASGTARGRTQIIDDCNHLGIVSDPDMVGRTARAIDSLLTPTPIDATDLEDEHETH